MKYIKIIDDFDNEEVCIVKTSLSTKELQRRIEELRYEYDLGYDDILQQISEVEVILIDEEIYI